MTTRRKPPAEPKQAAPQVNPIVKKAAEEVAARKVRRWGKDLRGDCDGQMELDLFAPEPKTPRRRRK